METMFQNSLEIGDSDSAGVTDIVCLGIGLVALVICQEHAKPIITACNAHDQLVAENAALRADLNDARSNWEAGAEELRQADPVRAQLVAALKIGRDVMALVGVQDHLIDYDAVSKGRKIVADALAAVGAVDLKGGAA